MKHAVNYDKNGNVLDVTDSDMEDIEYWESIAKEAVDKTVGKLHDKGISSVHADNKGIYEKSPDDKKTYLSEY